MSYNRPTPDEIAARRADLAPFDGWNERALAQIIAWQGVPRTYLDLGSGTGAMVNMARKMGVEAYGVDLISRGPGNEHWFIAHDLTEPLRLPLTFDLITCLEVAEHLPPDGHETLVDTIAAHLRPKATIDQLSGLLVFSAAPPGQAGEHHVGCRPAREALAVLRARPELPRRPDAPARAPVRLRDRPVVALAGRQRAGVRSGAGMKRVFINPTYQGADRADGGIRRVVEAQQRHLHAHGWQVVSSADEADLIANHGASLAERPGVPMVNHSHGMMWASYAFGVWGDQVNAALIDVMTRADAVTAPSQWVAQAISRGMLVAPEVVYHGVDADEWAHDLPPLGYVLWNKARADAVSDPDDMNRVAELLPDVPFLTTVGQERHNVMVLGVVPHDEMRPVVQRAAVYLATARETFGIGTLEALAAGVPVAGWRYGGQEIIAEGQTGYLAEPGDYAGLAAAIRRCLDERERLGANAAADARARWAWGPRIAQYAALYDRVLAAYHRERPAVSVIITCHNLARYLPDAVRSVQAQSLTDWECMIVDDQSTDGTPAVVERLAERNNKLRYLRTPSNLKLAGARNYGFAHAEGRYVLFLDADDMLSPNALDTLAGALDRDTGIHIAYGHLDTFNGDNPELTRGQWPAETFNWHGQIAHLNQLPYAAMLRREALERSGGYRVRDWRAEDAALWTRLTSLGFRAAKVTEDSTLLYRFRSDSKSADEARQHADRDGDWTAWYPWRLAGDPHEGLRAMQQRRQPNAALVPFGAQGPAPRPRRAWPVHHHQEPTVSVIIPVGPGHARYLVDALDSVQAQTFPFWECIVVNDTGAPLNLVAHPWARSMATLIHGAGHARNVGLEMARAPLVLFLDADDILTPNAIETFVAAYVDADAGYVYSDWAHLEDELRFDGPAVFHAVPEYDPYVWLSGAQHAVTCLVPTEHARAVGGFDEQLPAWEDWDFLIKLAVAGICGARVPQPLLVYRLATGERRKVGDAKEAELLAAIRDRYHAYGTGEKPMGTCCGGKANIVNQATWSLDLTLGIAGFDEPPAAPLDPSAPVRLEYIGDEWGEQVWFSLDRQRQYKAGRDPNWRYIDVDPRDVPHLLSFDRKFARVAMAPPESDDVSAPPMVLADEPRGAAPRARGRRA